MNAVRRLRNHEVDVTHTETIDARLDALRQGLDDVREDVRDLRNDVSSLRDKVDRNHNEMHAGFAAVRKEMATEFAAVRKEMASELTAVRSEMHTGFIMLRDSLSGLEKSVAGLRAMMKAALAIITLGVTCGGLFFLAGNSLGWFKPAPHDNARANAYIAAEAKGSSP